jgi:hypothetical protein
MNARAKLLNLFFNKSSILGISNSVPGYLPFIGWNEPTARFTPFGRRLVPIRETWDAHGRRIGSA